MRARARAARPWWGVPGVWQAHTWGVSESEPSATVGEGAAPVLVHRLLLSLRARRRGAGGAVSALVRRR